MIQHRKFSAFAVLVIAGATNAKLHADMLPAVNFGPGAVDVVPADLSTMVWVPLILLTLGCAAVLGWLVRSDRRRAVRPSGFLRVRLPRTSRCSTVEPSLPAASMQASQPAPDAAPADTLPFGGRL